LTVDTLTPAQQIDFFAGCVYVSGLHKVYAPDRGLLKPGQFRAAFAGYVFMMDNANQRVTRNAWNAFTQSEALRPPIVGSTCSRPDLARGTIVEEGGVRYLNLG
jgi:hypothetical protein